MRPRQAELLEERIPTLSTADREHGQFGGIGQYELAHGLRARTEGIIVSLAERIG